MVVERCAMNSKKTNARTLRPSTRAPIFAACAACTAIVVSIFAAGCGDGPASGTPSANRDQAKPEETKPEPKQPEQPRDADQADEQKYAEVTVKPNTGLPTTQATIAGKKFKLEVAATPETRRIGMMARESIDPSGGMVFVFPPSQFMVQNFWMGDCLTDMDILYLDEGGRILTMHEMKIQRRLLGESDRDYDARSKKYSSRYRSGLAVELAPGSIRQLKLKEGDLVRMDITGLKKMAK